MHTATYALEDQQRMARAVNYFAWQGRIVTRELGRRVVEVGCGIGNFTQMLLDRDLVIALDWEPSCIERVSQRFPGRRNLQTLVRDVARGGLADLAGDGIDSCVCLNVLEHMEDDAAALREIGSVLSPRGVIVLIVPAFPALYGPIDEKLGHYRRYTRASIVRLAVAAGLRVQTVRYMNFLGFFGWWANAHVFRREAQSEAQIAFFDRFLVPPQSALESVAAPPFGQSVFAVLRTP